MTRIPEPILVTGASGFIGRHLVQRLVADGYTVSALVLPAETVIFPPTVTRRRGDIRDAAAVQAALQGMQTVFHLAAVVGDWAAPSLFDAITIEGTRHVLAAASPQKTYVVLASSIVVYGDYLATRACPEDTPFGKHQGDYSRAKQAQERLLWDYAERYDLPCTIIRPANVYGAGSQPWVHGVIGQMRRRLPVLLGRTPHNAALSYVENLVDLFILAASQPAARRQVYNGADGNAVTWQQYFHDLADMIGVRLLPPLPLALARPLAGINEGVWRTLRLAGRPPLTYEALNLVGSDLHIPITRAQQQLGYAPRLPYAETLPRLAHYIREHGL
jgi:nucleoside-diphosphate-sugar epimerase